MVERLNKGDNGSLSIRIDYMYIVYGPQANTRLDSVPLNQKLEKYRK
jgi:hypothetical protein